MAVVVRLRRMGTNKQPFFRVVAADERCSNKGRFLETLGWYNPRKEGVNYDLNLERIDYWKGVGARTTETVDSLISKARRGDKEPEVAEPASSGKARKISDLPEESAAAVKEEPLVASDAEEEDTAAETADAELAEQTASEDSEAAELKDEKDEAAEPEEENEAVEAEEDEAEAESSTPEEEDKEASS